MQNIAIFDLVIISITLLLGIKGLFNGIIKELFGIFGIVGAIFISSRICSNVGEMIAPILGLENNSTAKIVGFIVSVFAVWLIIYILGIIVSKIFSASGLGIIDRFFGFLFGMGKIFLIFSVIAYVFSQVNLFKNLMDNQLKTSIVLPYLVDTGSYIIKIDISDYKPQDIDKAIQNVTGTSSTVIQDSASDIKDGVSSTLNDMQDSYKNTTQDAKEIMDSTLNDMQENIKEGVNKAVNDGIQEKINESIKSTQEKLKDIANKNQANQ